MLDINSQIKEYRRITTEIASMKQRLLNLRIDAGNLFDELEINKDSKVGTMNILSRAYDALDNAKQVVMDITKDRL
tara:strand:+ start:582 stop:809 length:228 start_codon:yes stop_codon:yes gene_type:complete